MAIEHNIRWKKGDYISLGKAVSQFNKKINELQRQEQRTYLPDLVNYKDIKQDITTRKELNRVLNSLKRFGREGAEELYITQAGEEMTKWERKELGYQSRIAQRRLTEELKELNKPNNEGISRVQMGSLRVKEIEAQIRNLKQIETKKGYDFRRLRERIQTQGTLDYKFRKASIYRQNYFKALKEGASNFENYELFKSQLEKIKNPVEFFEFIQQSQALSDFLVWYDEENGTLIYGGFGSNENAFNYGLEELGILE